MEDLLMQVTGALCGGAGLAVGAVFLIAVLKQFLMIGRPNELLVFSGRQRQLADGSSIGYREVTGGGRAFRIPVLEKVDRMELSTLPVDIRITNAYSKGGIPLTVHAVANVKVSTDPVVMKNAIERFMGHDRSEIRRVAKETLEGHLRGVLATLTPEEVNEDRLKFAGALLEEAEVDFDRLGLQLDTLKIQNVSDDVKYLDSIGRRRIAEVIRDAEVAESVATSQAKQTEAEAHQVGEVARQTAQTAIVQAENGLRQLRAQLEAEAKAEEEQAVAAAQQARAEAEAELQDVRKQLEQLRLQADVVLPAEAERKAAALRARGEAASIEENGRAMAEVLQMMTDTWLEAGDDAKDIFLIQQLEEVLRTVVSRVHGIELGEVTLLDSGDGQALPRHVASFPAMVRQVLDELRTSTGVDVTGILSGSTIGDPRQQAAAVASLTESATTKEVN
jgi:flotillin